MTATSRSFPGAKATPRRPALPDQLRQAPNPTAVDHIVSQLRDVILSGGFPSGSRLVELDLAERFAVSRGPIREALRKLEAQGLVTLRPNRGAVVRSLTADDVLEVYVMRASLGVMAIRQLIGAGLVNDEVIAHLSLLEEHARKRSSRKRQAAIIESDLAFQSGVVGACGLPRVTAHFHETTGEVKLFVAASGIVYPNIDQIVTDHAELLEAIIHRDDDRAVALWRARMRTAVREFLALIPGGTAIGNQRTWLWQLL